MVEFDEVAKLVDDDVVGYCGWEEDDFVVEIEVPFFRTAAPAAFVVFDKYFFDGQVIELVEIGKPRVHEGTRGFFVG